MNKISSFFSRLLLIVSITTAVSIATTSCENIFEEGGDCPYYVQFVYDMNMEYADAFSAQVKSVDLWIFDKNTGLLVDHVTDSGEALARKGYRMQLHVGPGDYTFVAWCGDENNRHFTVNSEVTRLSDVTCRMQRTSTDGVAMSDADLDLLFHGMETTQLPNWDKFDFKTWENTPNTTIARNRETGKLELFLTIPLTRDTNNLTLSLQHLSGQFDLEQLCIEMTDNNGMMNHDNSLDENDEPVTYYPWRTVTGTLDQGDLSTRAEEQDDNDHADNPDDSDNGKDSRYADFLVTEIATARLMAHHNPVIRIWQKDTGKTIFQIPVVKWATTLRSQHYDAMGDQEYLDREHQYNLQVYLQDNGNGGWMAVSIVINGWHIIDNGNQEL